MPVLDGVRISDFTPASGVDDNSRIAGYQIVGGISGNVDSQFTPAQLLSYILSNAAQFSLQYLVPSDTNILTNDFLKIPISKFTTQAQSYLVVPTGSDANHLAGAGATQNTATGTITGINGITFSLNQLVLFER